MREAIKPLPSARDQHCAKCQRRVFAVFGAGWFFCPTCRGPTVRSQALWGHEWAAVAFMAVACEEAMRTPVEVDTAARRPALLALWRWFRKRGLDLLIE